MTLVYLMECYDYEGWNGNGNRKGKGMDGKASVTLRYVQRTCLVLLYIFVSVCVLLLGFRKEETMNKKSLEKVKKKKEEVYWKEVL